MFRPNRSSSGPSRTHIQALYIVTLRGGELQIYPLSPTLFDMYLDEIIHKWQKKDVKEIPLQKNHQLLGRYLLMTKL